MCATKGAVPIYCFVSFRFVSSRRLVVFLFFRSAFARTAAHESTGHLRDGGRRKPASARPPRLRIESNPNPNRSETAKAASSSSKQASEAADLCSVVSCRAVSSRRDSCFCRFVRNRGNSRRFEYFEFRAIRVRFRFRVVSTKR